MCGSTFAMHLQNTAKIVAITLLTIVPALAQTKNKENGKKSN